MNIEISDFRQGQRDLLAPLGKKKLNKYALSNISNSLKFKQQTNGFFEVFDLNRVF